jgi:hypothetical protein
MPNLEPYPAWSEADDIAGKYEFVSKVSYTDPYDTRKRVFGYRANELYVKGTKDTYDPRHIAPPPRNGGWTLDKHYALEWSPSLKYQTGDKVWFEVGDPTKYSQYYIYIASPRYFGGHGRPNEEEDDDGIRTWELFFEQTYSFNSTVNPPPSTFTIPVRKKVGNHGGINNDGGTSTLETYPANTYPEDYNAGGYPNSGNVNIPWNRINSKYEASPYDVGCYEFWTYDKNGTVKTHRRRGIHRAQIYKNESQNAEVGLKEVADRQWFFVNQNYTYGFTYSTQNFPFFYSDEVYSTYNFSYRSGLGFSIEMWPSMQDSDFELVTKNYITKKTFNSDYRGYPFFDVLSEGVSMFGGDTNPSNGEETPPSPSQQCIMKVIARFNCATFCDRKILLRFSVVQSSYYWKQEVTYDENGFPHVYYNPVALESVASVIIQELDTKDSSYISDLTSVGSVPFLVKEYNFSNRLSPRTFTSISLIGWSFV